MVAESLKKKEERFTFEMIDALIRYEPETGFFYWKRRTPEMFANPLHDGVNAANSFNEMWEGKQALTQIDGRRGYVTGQILKTVFRAHRVAWLLHYGSWPTESIDHIDGNKSNNKIENLRDANSVINGRNRAMQSNNSSGYTGVRLEQGRWRASIRLNGKRKHIGYYDTIEEAVEARVKVQRDNDFTERHGK